MNLKNGFLFLILWCVTILMFSGWEFFGIHLDYGLLTLSFVLVFGFYVLSLEEKT